LRTRLHANSIGALAAQALSGSESRTIGEILAAFPNSFYLKTSDHELIFVTNRQVKSPITINLEPETDLAKITKPLEAVCLQEDEMHVGESASIDLSEASKSSQELVPQDYRLSMCREILYFGSLILMVVDNRPSVLDPSGLAYADILEFVSKGVIPLRQSSDTRRFWEAAKKIVGLGSGFTPSGDDLLGGFLATYNSFAHEIGRKPLVLDFGFLEGKTSWISAKLLDYMQRRVLDEQLRDLIDSAASGDTDGFLMALGTLLPRGHTSGIDILVGVILALGLTFDIDLKMNETQVIVRRLGLSS
jgi:hypothetical protein